MIGTSTFDAQTVEFKVGDTVIGNGTLTSTGTYEIPYTGTPGKQSVTVTVTDTSLYTGIMTDNIVLIP